MRLVSFAVHWIRAEIHEYVLRNWRLVKVATTKAQRKLFFNLRKIQEQPRLADGRGDEGGGARSRRQPAEVTEMERRLSARDLSFDPAPDADDEEDVVFARPPTCRRPMPIRPPRWSAPSGTTT